MILLIDKFTYLCFQTQFDYVSLGTDEVFFIVLMLMSMLSLAISCSKLVANIFSRVLEPQNFFVQFYLFSDVRN